MLLLGGHLVPLVLQVEVEETEEQDCLPVIVEDAAALLTLLGVMGGLPLLALGLCAEGAGRHGLAGDGEEQAGHVQGAGDDGSA